ncbi:hypothetical protein [Actinophytocola algeriensis]|uniref:Uncharacterized protein n=1 Tax=Actinophytocola algeriensis TaxID=1768010 RepID=A0A7W7VDL7_9PSEU|nr:hypothetical protein [Actinophytocola algeriensis]MBB4906120.1 hypothetical protein [Actinophytocola algeriensis]MBE1472195.1 hypothetical protein [Actinophytocola algeriensis]
MAPRRAEQKPSGRGEPDDGPPDPVPVTGRFLLAGIDAVLPRLTPPAPPTPQLVEDLRAALARTAACGETCQVAAAADDVRLATTLLLAGSTDEACQALRHARTALIDRPDTHR